MKNYYAEGHSKHVHLNTTDSNIIDYRVSFISHLLPGKHNYFLFQPCRLSTQRTASCSDHTDPQSSITLCLSQTSDPDFSCLFPPSLSQPHFTFPSPELFTPPSSQSVQGGYTNWIPDLPYLYLRILCETCHSVPD